MISYCKARSFAFALAITALICITLARGWSQTPAVSNPPAGLLPAAAGVSPPAATLTPVEAIHNLSLVVQKIAGHARARDRDPALALARSDELAKT